MSRLRRTAKPFSQMYGCSISSVSVAADNRDHMLKKTAWNRDKLMPQLRRCVGEERPEQTDRGVERAVANRQPQVRVYSYIMYYTSGLPCTYCICNSRLTD